MLHNRQSIDAAVWGGGGGHVNRCVLEKKMKEVTGLFLQAYLSLGLHLSCNNDDPKFASLMMLSREYVCSMGRRGVGNGGRCISSS